MIVPPVISTSAAPTPSKAERTRAAILDAAEARFAAQGFSATRLEDVAEAVGIRRASIVYYFKDKRELYDAVLENVLSDLLERLDAVLFGPGTPARRIEEAVSAWVDYVAERPAFARLLLREVADATPEGGAEAMLRQLSPFQTLIRRFVLEGGGSKLPPGIDAIEMASAVAGTTLFHVAALPALVPRTRDGDGAPARLERHRAELLRLTRRFLRGRPARSARPAPTED